MRAHRVEWIIHKGPIAPGVFVLHKCDNPPCYRFDHLRLGTSRDNIDDMVRKRRSLFGERGPNAKLTEYEIKLIRLLYSTHRPRFSKTAWTQVKLARLFGISQPQISQIVRRTNWTHI